MPHEVRMRPQKRKKNKEVTVKKTEQQVLQEFELLHKMFNINLAKEDDSELDPEILDTLSFSDNSYNDLWDRIIGQMDLTSNENVQRTKGISSALKDEEINDVVGRIMKEAV